MVGRRPVLIFAAIAALTSVAQDTVLFGRQGLYRVWCDPLREPLIIEISGPKLGILDTLVGSGPEYVGKVGHLLRLIEPRGAWTYVSEELKMSISLKPKRPTRRHMDRRRYVYSMEAFWTIRDLQNAWDFPEYSYTMYLTEDFDDFIHRRNVQPRYIREFYTALRLRNGSTK
jgi:hypothetical protein